MGNKITDVLVILFILTLFSCSKEDVVGIITINRSTLDIEFFNAVPSEGGTRELNLESSVDWTISVNDTRTSSWVSVEPSSGLAGEVTTKITIFESTMPGARSAQIIFKSGDGEVLDTITINQSGVEFEFDRAILIALYDATAGEHWKNNTNWGSGKPIFEWYGVGGENKVERLDLSDNNLMGQIPAKIGDLTNLAEVYLCNNKLTGSIPSSIIDHSKWDLFWRNNITQKNGFGFDLREVRLMGAKHSVTDIDGDYLVFSDVYSKNKYTVCLQWSKGCDSSVQLINELIDVYKEKHLEGLEVIAYPTGVYGNEDNANYIQQNGLTIWNNFYLDGVNSSVDVRTTNFTPSVEVIDQNGHIVFASIGNTSVTDDRFGRLAYSELIPFLEENIGAVEPPQYYESTDYSEDGKVITLQSATTGNGIDLVILGDGFSDKDMGTNGEYEQRMSEAMDYFFSEEPYKTYRNRYNVYCVKAVSKNEIYADGTETVFGCEFGYGTSIYGDNNKVLEYALKVPSIPNTDNLTVVTILNSANYAGTCYMYYTNNASVSYCPIVGYDDEQYKEIVAHEVGGHGFAKLMDEYNYSGIITADIISNYQYTETLGWGANVDVTNSPTDISWAHLLSDSRYKDLVGIYEGALTFQYGAYRPTVSSIMRHNTGGYNAPSREAIYKLIMELSGDTYNYEEFVTYDEINRNARTTASHRSQAASVDMMKFVPLAPPVVVYSKPNVSK